MKACQDTKKGNSGFQIRPIDEDTLFMVARAAMPARSDFP